MKEGCSPVKTACCFVQAGSEADTWHAVFTVVDRLLQPLQCGYHRHQQNTADCNTAEGYQHFHQGEPAIARRPVHCWFQWCLHSGIGAVYPLNIPYWLNRTYFSADSDSPPHTKESVHWQPQSVPHSPCCVCHFSFCWLLGSVSRNTSSDNG